MSSIRTTVYARPGGSSSGSGALVASREVDMALGGDQGGSIRVPSAWCGIYGLKPTYGLVPYTGAFPIELTLDHLGPMPRSTADCALLMEVIAGPHGLDPRQHASLSTAQYAKSLTGDVRGLKLAIVAIRLNGPSSHKRSVREIRGVPIGMMLVGTTGDEATVLRAADAWQRKFGA